MIPRLAALRAVVLSFAAGAPCAWAQVVYTATLSGAAEVPPNASTATGSATITYFPATSTMTVAATFSGLSANVTASHIHCCTIGVGTTNAGVASQTPSFIGFPTGVTAGTYQQTFDLTLASSYNAAFVNASGGSVAVAMQRLLDGMGNGTAYFNIHTTMSPGGEIRGNLVEPGIFRSGFD